MDIELFASYPLWKLFRARKGWAKAGNRDLVALADEAIELRIQRVGGAK